MSDENLRVRLKPVVLPCPCCGNKNLYIGHESSDTFAVVCWAHGGGCGLRMIVRLPDTMGKAKTLTQVEHGCMRKAVRLWNRRKR